MVISINDEKVKIKTVMKAMKYSRVYHVKTHSAIAHINLRFLLLLASDIERNPGPENINSCPCDEEIFVSGGKIVLYITCTKCQQKWHVRCVGLEGITEAPLKKLTQWCCPSCYVFPEKATTRNQTQNNLITQMKKELESLETRLCDKIEKQSQPAYSQIASKIENKIEDIGKNQKEGNKLAKAILNQTKPSDTPEELERQARILVVRKPNAPDIRSSGDIREHFNKRYGPSFIIKHTRNTVGGSILLEFADIEMANKIMNSWDKKLFGGNEGVSKLQPRHTAGIIKQVSKSYENDIIDEIKEQFPQSHIELFRKDKKFTGTVKIIFKDEDSLKKAIESKCKINNQIYVIDIFIPKPKVIKCNVCQTFGHVSRRCWNTDKPICGKCGEQHETKDCEVNEQDFKCFHCNGNHITGSYSCEKMKEKLEQICAKNNV